MQDMMHRVAVYKNLNMFYFSFHICIVNYKTNNIKYYFFFLCTQKGKGRFM